MPDLDWSDLKHALAVAEAGSLAGASRQLGVNHTTVLRRLDALEAKLGTRLFDRKRSGYEPTEAGQAVLVRALGVSEVIVATGAQRNAPAIPGADQHDVCSGDELRRLTHRRSPDEHFSDRDLQPAVPLLRGHRRRPPRRRGRAL